MSRRGGGLSLPLLAALLLISCFASPAHSLQPGPAGSGQAGPALRARAAALVPLFNRSTKPERILAPSFLAQIPASQIDSLALRLAGQYGRARAVERLVSKSATAGTAFIAFERAVVRVELAIEARPPHRITALLVSAAEVKGDSLAKVAQEIWSLPGEASLAVARLRGSDAAQFSIAHKAGKPLAVGSAFKLFILAELSRSIAAGERKWGDVVPLDHFSIGSGALESWPAGSPMTLHTLAVLMISQSDNGAADTLLHLLGREKVERLLPELGIAAPDRLRPLLTTREWALLKAGDSGALLRRWAGSSEAERRALLAGPMAALKADQVDLSRLIAVPNAIDTVEWFASTGDLVRVMNWLRRHGDRETLGILAVNPGIGRVPAEEFAYLGYKGGSETGVLNMTFLLRGKDGEWRAVSGTWNDPAQSVDEGLFQLLMSRAIALVR
ncbi:serine hydrolase [Sphingomonas sp.]|uniref:serine hydrolase n=1 Tax=Sphingomonas sp. TaxID=28214 RepID=UPI002FC88E73